VIAKRSVEREFYDVVINNTGAENENFEKILSEMKLKS